jgi:Uma2 family endonuclease
MGFAQVQVSYTPEEYLAYERKAATKHEYWHGEIYAMAGASPSHNLITFNVAVTIGGQIKGRNCRGYSTDQKVRTDVGNLFAYPDVTIVCGEPKFHDEKKDVILNPTLIVEVLSPSTESLDRTEKFAHYRTIPSLMDYILIAQDKPSVEHFTRQKGKRAWLYNAETELTSSLWIASLKCELKLADIYDLVELAPPRPVLLEVVKKPAKAAAQRPKPKKTR